MASLHRHPDPLPSSPHRHRKQPPSSCAAHRRALRTASKPPSADPPSRPLPLPSIPQIRSRQSPPPPPPTADPPSRSVTPPSSFSLHSMAGSADQASQAAREGLRLGAPRGRRGREGGEARGGRGRGGRVGGGSSRWTLEKTISMDPSEYDFVGSMGRHLFLSHAGSLSIAAGYFSLNYETFQLQRVCDPKLNLFFPWAYCNFPPLLTTPTV